MYSPAQPARGTVSRRPRSVQYGEIMTRPVKTDLGNVILRGEQSFCEYLKVPKPYGLCTETMHFFMIFIMDLRKDRVPTGFG